MSQMPTHCSHGLPLADPDQPCIDCEVDRYQGLLHEHLTRAQSCANKLAQLAHRNREAKK